MSRSALPASIANADAKSLLRLLESGSLKSVDIVNQCLDQIEEHHGYLHTMLSMPPRQVLRAVASSLDDERAAERLRGPLHGIPAIIKVRRPLTCKPLTMTDHQGQHRHPSQPGMKTTASSLTLLDSKPRENAPVAQKELSNFK
ncbi:unnamed protein product [Clonostachys rhizophaga]|uniref:Amidase domain-containing protein n=1 Tax=Clonostachys rhizophaga TaxID=160324 RepID=A0A9N9VJ99_9HYPO|nr:unnamed protein product [Clonostachys rhizophaga]